MAHADTSDIERRRALIVERLQGRSDLSGVAILEDVRGDMLARARQAEAKYGVLALVRFAGGKIRQHQSKQAVVDPCRFVVAIAENVKINDTVGTRKSAGFVAERVAAELHMIDIGGHVLRVTDIIEDPDLRDSLTYDGFLVRLETRNQLLPRQGA